MTTALLIIDIQNDYFPGGAMALHGPEAAAANAAKLLAAFRQKGRPVIHVQHISTRPGATFFLPNTRGAEIHESVKPQPGETVFQKNFPNCFRDTKLLAHLKGAGIDALTIAGMMTHMCVDTTTRAAADLGFACSLAHDATATRELAFGGAKVPAEQVQLSYLAGLNGPFAKVLPADELCRAL
ncbi:MAG TPA: cysteine hydrolase family protein [Burkholderiales bacterium]|nr:cysteine hydrolase family protein [Burkholderiales bacterium]